jgi:electron transfer flavoprotein beta subunit
MKIIVCIKRVPDTAARIKVEGDGIDPNGIEWCISPYDEYAIEVAAQIAEANEGTEIVVLSLGPKASTKEVRTALAMGGDRAILLVDENHAARDAYSTAKALADVITEESADLVCFGRQSVDTDNAAVGGYVAGLLGRPVVTFVSTAKVEGGTLRANRDIEGATEVVEAPLPAIVTMTKGPDKPRYPNLKGIMKAKKKPLDEREAPAIEGKVKLVALEPPPERPEGKIVGEGVEAVGELVRLLREEAKVI